MAEMQDRPPVALFRAREDAVESAGKLHEMGFEAVPLPVIETRALGLALAHPRYEAVLATSAKAFLSEARLDRDTPLYCVGERTGRAAEGAGGGWRLLPRPMLRPSPSSCAELSPGASVLYLAGRDRKRTLEDALGGIYDLEVAEAYAAEARAGFSEADCVALACCRAALHCSRRSVEPPPRLRGALEQAATLQGSYIRSLPRCGGTS